MYSKDWTPAWNPRVFGMNASNVEPNYFNWFYEDPSSQYSIDMLNAHWYTYTRKSFFLQYYLPRDGLQIGQFRLVHVNLFNKVS